MKKSRAGAVLDKVPWWLVTIAALGAWFLVAALQAACGDAIDSVAIALGEVTAIVPAERRRHLTRFDAKSSQYAVAATHARDAG